MDSICNEHSRYENNNKHKNTNIKKPKQTSNNGSIILDKTQAELTAYLNDDKYILIRKHVLKEILDNKIKSLEQRQQNDFNRIASLISKENEAIPHIIESVPRLIEKRIQENEQRRQLEKLKEENLINKIKVSLHKERKALSQRSCHPNNSFQIQQITQLPSLYIGANHKQIVDVSAIVKEKVLENVVREFMRKNNTNISECVVAKDVSGEEKELRELERKQALRKEQKIKDLEMECERLKEMVNRNNEKEGDRDVNDMNSKMEKSVKFDIKDQKTILKKVFKEKSNSMEDNKSSKKPPKENITTNNKIQQQ